MDEKLLYDTFSAFGSIVSTPKIMRDPDTGNSRGFGFVAFDAFEARKTKHIKPNKNHTHNCDRYESTSIPKTTTP